MARLSLDPSSSSAARAGALAMLARREHPRRQLIAKLVAKGFNADVAAAAVDGLVAENLVSDRRFVEHFVAYHADRGDGPAKIRHALRSSGVDGELLENMLGAVEDWPVRAVRCRVKKFGAALPSQYSDKARQARFLAARGFTSNQIRAALDFDSDDET